MQDNDNSPILVANGNNLVPGQFYFANESRLHEGNFSEPLTAYALGWRDPSNIQATLDFLAPPVQVGRRFEYATGNAAEPFLSEANDIRGIGAEFRQLEYTSGKATGQTLNKGLTVRVDMDNVEGNPNWRSIYTGRVMNRLLRNELRRTATLILAAAHNVAKTWDTTALKDPDQDVMTQLITSTDASGVRPNRILYGATAWAKRILAHRAQNTAGGFSSAGLNESELAAFLGVDQVRRSEERYLTVGSASSATKSQVIGGVVVMFYADNVVSPEDSSNAKRFISPTLGGTPFRVYEQQINAKLIDITVEHYSIAVVTASAGIEKFTVS